MGSRHLGRRAERGRRPPQSCNPGAGNDLEVGRLHARGFADRRQRNQDGADTAAAAGLKHHCRVAGRPLKGDNAGLRLVECMSPVRNKEVTWMFPVQRVLCSRQSRSPSCWALVAAAGVQAQQRRPRRPAARADPGGCKVNFLRSRRLRRSVLRLEPAMAPAGALSAGTRAAEGLPALEVRFRDLTFGYPGGAPVLEGFDLTIPAGSSMAIVGQVPRKPLVDLVSSPRPGSRSRKAECKPDTVSISCCCRRRGRAMCWWAIPSPPSRPPMRRPI